MSAGERHDDDRPALVATPSQTVGPFFSFGLTTNQALGRMAATDDAGERLRLCVRILDGAGAPVPDALVELSQAHAAGRHLFGRLPTDADGACVFDTVRPAQPGVATREAVHINVCLFMRGLMRHVYTRIYFAGDPALQDDPVLALVAEDRRETLVAQRNADAADVWEFDVRLQGDRETVFFDL